MLARCSVIVSDHNVELAGHSRNLVGQGPVTDCYFQHWIKNEGFVLLLYCYAQICSKEFMTVAGNGTLIFLFPNASHFHGGIVAGKTV